MFYHVQAKFRQDTAADFLTKLTDGTISSQKPDGKELVAAMERAVINSDGNIEWSEMCFCKIPLDHERSTVLDNHFDDFQIQEIDRHASYEGGSFMTMLRDLAKDAVAP